MNYYFIRANYPDKSIPIPVLTPNVRRGLYYNNATNQLTNVTETHEKVEGSA